MHVCVDDGLGIQCTEHDAVERHKYPDQPFCGVGHDVAVNDLAPEPMRANTVLYLGDDDGAVHGANLRQNRREHRREGLHVETKQFSNGKRAAVALGLENRAGEGAELAAPSMISASEMRALAVEDWTASIYHHAAGSGMKRERFASHRNGS